MLSGKRVISFSLYGDLPLYTAGALQNAELVNSIYPGWIARFYVDDTVPQNFRAALTARGAEIVHVTAPSLGPMYGRYWRSWIAADPDVERFIVRDVDSRINSRERAAVDAWTASNKSFHLMRDSQSHARRVLAGMWGGVGGTIPSIRTLTDTWGRYSEQGQNDLFMSEQIFPLMGDDYICHDSNGHFSDAQPFPAHSPMQGTSFVGEIVTPEIQNQDVWRQVGEYREQIYQMGIDKQRAETRILLLTQSFEMRDGPASLRLVLPLARFIHICVARFRRIFKRSTDSY